MRSAAVPGAPAQLPPLQPPGHIVGSIELPQHQFAEAKRLHAAGWSYRRIAQELQLNRRIVLRYVQAEQLPRRILPQSTSSVTPYLGYLRERWAAGCQQGTQLLKGLQAQGYRGSLSSIYRALRAFRSSDGRPVEGGAAVERVAVRSPHQDMWLLLREEKDLTDEDVTYQRALCGHDATIGQAAALGQRFLTMVRERQADALDGWLADAEASDIKELRGLAQSLQRHHAAVSMALS
jgi:transposase